MKKSCKTRTNYKFLHTSKAGVCKTLNTCHNSHTPLIIKFWIKKKYVNCIISRRKNVCIVYMKSIHLEHLFFLSRGPQMENLFASSSYISFQSVVAISSQMPLWNNKRIIFFLYNNDIVQTLSWITIFLLALLKNWTWRRRRSNSRSREKKQLIHLDYYIFIYIYIFLSCDHLLLMCSYSKCCDYHHCI